MTHLLDMYDCTYYSLQLTVADVGTLLISSLCATWGRSRLAKRTDLHFFIVIYKGLPHKAALVYHFFELKTNAHKTRSQDYLNEAETEFVQTAFHYLAPSFNADHVTAWFYNSNWYLLSPLIWSGERRTLCKADCIRSLDPGNHLKAARDLCSPTCHM